MQQAGKVAVIGRRTVREASVSRHNGGQSEGPPLTPRYHSTMMFEGLMGGPQIVPHYAERR